VFYPIGLLKSVTASDELQADPDTLLSEDEIALVREVFGKAVGGNVEYVPWRGKLEPKHAGPAKVNVVTLPDNSC
jgi:hypothetical protein